MEEQKKIEIPLKQFEENFDKYWDLCTKEGWHIILITEKGKFALVPIEDYHE